MLSSVYVIEAGPYYKIGRTSVGYRPQFIVERMLAHSPKLPLAPIRVIGDLHCFTDDVVSVESALHRKFDTKRTRGEWFLLSQDDLRWIFAQDELPAWPSGLLCEYSDVLGLTDAIEAQICSPS